MALKDTTIRRIQSWILDEASPLWISHGIQTGNGGPVEVFPITGETQAVPAIMRTRVAGRQLYAFSHAHLMGIPDALDAASRVFDHMTDRIWTGSGTGWCKTLTPEGRPLDRSQDLYDFSFCLFGLAWYFEASGDARALTLARQTLSIIQRDMRHSSGIGFVHSLPVSPPRQQNPHMHLMEAVLKLQSVSPNDQQFQLAAELASLFSDHFYNSEVNCLPEFFTEELEPIAEQSGAFRFEPGHQFEWAWILAQHQKISGADHSELINRLVASSEKYGVCAETGLTYNGVDSSGRVLDSGSRTWPNTERIKGWLGLYETTGASPWEAVESSCTALFTYHLGQAPKTGLWSDEFSKDGRPLATTVPASTLYHLYLAFSEVLRLAASQENSTRSWEK